MIDFAHFNSIIEIAEYFNSKDRCLRAIRDSRWENGDVVCPYCGAHHCVERTDGRYRCHHCKRNFSVLVGTIFENTKISLVKWFMAMYLIAIHPFGRRNLPNSNLLSIFLLYATLVSTFPVFFSTNL